jgi:hypothetical protein
MSILLDECAFKFTNDSEQTISISEDDKIFALVKTGEFMIDMSDENRWCYDEPMSNEYLFFHLDDLVINIHTSDVFSPIIKSYKIDYKSEEDIEQINITYKKGKLTISFGNTVVSIAEIKSEVFFGAEGVYGDGIICIDRTTICQGCSDREVPTLYKDMESAINDFEKQVLETAEESTCIPGIILNDYTYHGFNTFGYTKYINICKLNYNHTT